MARTLRISLTDDQAARLKEAAAYLHRTPSETAATYVAETLRERQFRHIDFRDNAGERLAYVRGTGLKVWLTVRLLRVAYDNNVHLMAQALETGDWAIQAAVDYATAYPEEIEPLIAQQESVTVEKLKENIPNLVVFEGQ